MSSSLEAVSVDCVDGSSCLDDSDCCFVMPSLVVGLEVCLASVCWLSLFEAGFSDFTVVLWCVSFEVVVVSFVVDASSVWLCSLCKLVCELFVLFSVWDACDLSCSVDWTCPFWVACVSLSQ